MHRRRHQAGLSLAGLVVISLMAVACSSGGSATGGSSPGSTSPDASTAASGVKDQAAIALLPASMKPGSTLKDGLEASQPPWEFVGSDNQLQGVDIDIAHALAARLGLNITIANVNFATLIPAVQSGRYDLSTSGYGDNTVREKVIDMIDYAQEGASLLVAAGNPHHVTMTAACGQKVAMLANSQMTDIAAPVMTKACAAARKKPVDIVATSTSSDPVVALTSGRAVAALMGTSQAAYVISKQPGKFEMAPGDPVAPAAVGFAVAKHSPLTPAFLKVLNDMLADGSYQKILDKWGVGKNAVASFEVNAVGKASS